MNGESMEFLTHRHVEAILKTFMEEHGWRRIERGKYNFGNIDAKPGKGWRLKERTSGKPRHGSAGILYPDAVFTKGSVSENSTKIVAEVKPENVKMPEIMRGIGQSVRFLPFRKVKPYLVIPTKWYEILLSVFKELPRIGIITYDNKGRMKIAQRGEDKTNNW